MADWKSILGQIAPTFATAIGGPAAGIAVNFFAKQLLGSEPESTEEGLKAIEAAVLGASPEQLANIKQIEANFKIEMKRLEINVYELDVENQKSARESGDRVLHIPQAVLTLITVTGFFALMMFMLGGEFEVDEVTDRFLYMMVGSLLTYVSMIFRYWFGGSQTDERNLEKIYNSVPRGRNERT